MADAVLTINAGSSSLKFALFETEGEHKRVAHGVIEAIGEAPHFRGYDQTGDLATERRWQEGRPGTASSMAAPNSPAR